MWKHRLERTSPRKLNRTVERDLKRRRDGVWGVERALRSIVSKWIDHPEEWPDIIQRWVLRQADPDAVWPLVEVVLLDWLIDPTVTEEVRSRVRTMTECVGGWMDIYTTSNRDSGVIS